MRRSMMAMLVALGALSTTLAAQSNSAPQAPPAIKERPHAIGFGFVATLGANWQMEGIEIAYARRLRRGLAAISVSSRIGTFINESSMLGGTKGVVFGATLAGRTRMKSIAQFGMEEHGTGIGFDVTFEVTGYTASQALMSQGARWLAVSVLPAFSIGSGDAPHFGIVIGPTAFFSGGKPSMRGMLAFRGEAPLARRERRP
ncbi:MAG: hypothetical protein ACREMI_03905 [Gemmatimonadales bacterium]